MINKKLVYGAIAITFIVAVLALYVAMGSKSLGGATQTVTTNYPSLGVNSLIVGTGCDDQFKTCNGAVINGLGVETLAGILSTTTPASMTLAPSDLAYSTISMLPTVAAITVTLPATTTAAMASFLPNTGDRASIMFINASTTAAINITLAGGTGTLLKIASSSALILPNSAGILHFVRKANTDIIAGYIPLTP